MYCLGSTTRGKSKIRGIQVILSNGVRSPLFECLSTAKLEEIAINSEVKRIRGSDEQGNCVGAVHFIDKYGSEIARIEQSETKFAPDQELNEDE